MAEENWQLAQQLTTDRTSIPAPLGTEALQSESIHVIREVLAEFDRPCLLFSGGKDSIVMLHMAMKAVWPATLPIPLVHIDTGHNFPEVIKYRDEIVDRYGLELIVASVDQAIEDGSIADTSEPDGSRNRLQTPVLLGTIRKHRFGAIFGGARRDEERSRAKERMYSFRDEFGQWDPKSQRPEIWNLYNGATNSGQHIRVFPLSNWTEADVWRYIVEEEIDIPSIYLSHLREVFERDGMLMSVSPFIAMPKGQETCHENVRFRTIGDMTSTAATRSTATNAEDVLTEILATRTSERGSSRADDKTSDAAMEDRKREGYF